MNSLYEINQQLLDAMNIAHEKAESNDGELSDDIVMYLDTLEMERETKIGNIARYIKNQLAESEMVKAEEKRLSERRKACENKAKSLKNYLTSCLNDGETYSDENTKISWRKSESVKITGEIPDEYCKIERKPILTDIKKAINGGKLINAIIETKQNIQIK